MKNRKGNILLAVLYTSLAIIVIAAIFFTKRIYNNKADVKPIYDTTSYVTNVFEISGDPYDLKINVIITKDINKALRYVQLNTDSTITKDDFESSVGVTFTGKNSPTIWIDSVDRSTEGIAKANHELLHALFYIMQRANILLSYDNDEAFAYEYDYLTNQFFKHIK